MASSKVFWLTALWLVSLAGLISSHDGYINKVAIEGKNVVLRCVIGEATIPQKTSVVTVWKVQKKSTPNGEWIVVAGVNSDGLAVTEFTRSPLNGRVQIQNKTNLNIYNLTLEDRVNVMCERKTRVAGQQPLPKTFYDLIIIPNNGIHGQKTREDGGRTKEKEIKKNTRHKNVASSSATIVSSLHISILTAVAMVTATELG